MHAHLCDSDGCDKDFSGQQTIHPWLVVPLHRTGSSVQGSVAAQPPQMQQLTFWWTYPITAEGEHEKQHLLQAPLLHGLSETLWLIETTGELYGPATYTDSHILNIYNNLGIWALANIFQCWGFR